MEIVYKVVYLPQVIAEDIPALPQTMKERIKRAIEERLTTEPVALHEIEKRKDSPPRLLLLDDDMPKMSGLELVQKLHLDGIHIPTLMAVGRIEDTKDYVSQEGWRHVQVVGKFPPEIEAGLKKFGIERKSPDISPGSR